MNSRIIICGPSGSGKDHLKNIFVKRGFKYCPLFTTRPLRKNEINGREYFFVTDEEFFEKRKTEEIFIQSSFMMWHYGLTKEQWLTPNGVFIMSPHAISQIPKEERKNTFIIYLKPDRNIILKRLIERSDSNDSIARRMDSDDADFMNFTDYDIKITNPNF